MKKGIAAILLIFYFAFSSGIVINLHYCMNRLDSSKLGAAKSELCTKCGMPTNDSNGCCHDVVKVIKIQDDQQTSALNFKFNSPGTFVDHTFINDVDFIHKERNNLFFANHSPPLNEQYTWLINCVFRI